MRYKKLIEVVYFLQETVEFDILFEKVFKWNASSFEDKEAFITCLWKVIFTGLFSIVIGKKS